jgi:hypothetical protein
VETRGEPFPKITSIPSRYLPYLHAPTSSPQACAPEPHAVEIEVHHRRGVEREQLAHEQPADDGDAERPAQLRAYPRPSASGSAPSSAARVVIRIGRKRSRHAR